MKRTLLTLLLGLSACFTTSAQSPLDISESNPLDLTSMITNASCQNAPGWQHHTGEQAGTGGSNYAKDVALFNSSDYAGMGIESWTSAPVTNCDIIYQDLFLPAGDYILEACVVAQVYVSDTQHGANSGGIMLFMGDKQTRCTKNTWQRLSVKMSLSEEGYVRIGVKANSSNRNTWISIADVHLKMTAMGDTQSALSLDENYDTYLADKDLLANVFLHKYLPADKYVALCIPVSLSEEKASSHFQSIMSIQSATLKDSKITFTTQPEKTIEAGKVYLVKSKKTTDGLTPLGMSLVSATTPPVVKLGGLSLQGTYRVHEHRPDCYILNEDGDAFVPATGRAHINGFGAYIK